MNASIRTLLNFLQEHNYPDHQISQKTLTRPSVKDFHNIIGFLFKQLDPNFAFKDKFEDDVVSMFKHLGYPTAISKSNISAVGSPHAWPSIMAAMMWLVELLNYDEICTANPVTDDAEDLSDKAFYSYLAESYGLFLQGDDEQHSLLENEFRESLDRKNRVVTEQTEQLEMQNEKLRREIAALEDRRAELPELEEKKLALISDLGKFATLIDQLQNHKVQLHQKTQDREAELERLSVSYMAVSEEISALTQRVHSQELSAQDVEKLVAERERLEGQQQHASENRQAIQHKVWESEIKLRDNVQALEDSAKAYNSIAEELKLVPVTARNARGKNLSMCVDTRAKTGSGLLKTNVAYDIVPHLTSLRTELETTIRDYRTELHKEQEDQDQIERKCVELDGIQIDAQNKIRKSEETYRREKAALEEVISLSAKEVEELEQRLLHLTDIAQEEARGASATRKISEIKLNSEALRQDQERTKSEIISAIMEVVSSCAGHRELVRSRLDDIKDQYMERLQEQLDYVAKFHSFDMNSK
jgi:kinetochore protein NDC80